MKPFFCIPNRTKALLAGFVLASFAVAHADTMLITYYTIAGTDLDGGKLGLSTSTSYVQNTLGPDGLPVLNPGHEGSGGNAPKDVLGNDELTWWSPTLNKGGAGGVSDVTETGTAVVSLPFAKSNFYAPNGTGKNDSTEFQAATLSGNIAALSAETISFSVSSDDMAFVYLDGVNVCDDGGVHGATAVACTSATVSAGDHSLEVFYVDLDPTQAVLDFSITATSGKGETTTPTPEPSSLLLFGSGLLGLAGFVRRKVSRKA